MAKSPQLDELFPESYARLQRIAHRQLMGSPGIRTLDTGGLVHEAYLKLAQQEQAFIATGQFYALAAQAMRRILIDYARKQKRQKRGGDLIKVTLEDQHVQHLSSDNMLDLHEAVVRYEQLNPRGAKIIELWFFGGFKQVEIAEILDISEITVRREWRLSKAWLSRQLKEWEQ